MLRDMRERWRGGCSLVGLVLEKKLSIQLRLSWFSSESSEINIKDIIFFKFLSSDIIFFFLNFILFFK